MAGRCGQHINCYFLDPIYSNMQKKLLEKHQAEKEGDNEFN